MPKLSDRVGTFAVSASSAMSAKARELAARGVKVVSLSTGEPDFATPEHIIEAAMRAARDGDTHYPPLDGKVALKQAVQRKFKRENRLDYALNEITIGNGSKQLIFNALMATLDPGDEVIVPVPCYASYVDMAKANGGRPVPVACPQNNGFRLRPEDLDAAITPQTRWVMLNFPNNPTGAIVSREELKAVAEVLLRHPHVWVMTDDVYEHLFYTDAPFSTIAEVEPALKDRVLTINSCSKAYAMTGWRVGYCGGPKPLIDAMLKCQAQVTSGVSTVGQAAAVAALDGPQDTIGQWRDIYRQRRDFMLASLGMQPLLSCHRPEGAFYAFPNITSCFGKTTRGGKRLQTDTDLALALLDEANVSTVQGSAYLVSGYLRLSYATDMASLEEACERLRTFLDGLQ